MPQDFPVFVLCLLICETEQYADQIVPAFLRLKFEYFGHEAVILHSRDIRKAQGIQMADLAGYPVARYVLNPARPSEAFNVIRAKFYKGPGWVQGLKIFP